ncbi:MAG: carboxypeptidase regulatory-like domain-containing protein [Acidobacteria bacterium]|nr:carboxypeptidase regulatory-like domain-containing protein [Acidobacteriota bacterium]
MTAREARAAQTDARPAGVLVGTVQETAGQPLGGVQVSAKAAGTTITTTVFTDEQGRYFFPAMRGGPYRVWAQAVGFARAPAEVTIVAGARIHQAFTLHRLGTLDEIAPQLSESEWIAALPEDTREKRRMKEILRVNCGMCHSIASVLQHRFDERGWLNMIQPAEPAPHGRISPGGIGRVPGRGTRPGIAAPGRRAASAPDGRSGAGGVHAVRHSNEERAGRTACPGRQ